METNTNLIYLACFNAVKKRDFKGYDPYDLLNSRFGFLQKLPPRVLFYLSQINKRSFVNLRPVLGVRPSLIPKGKSLILQSLIHQKDLFENVGEYLKLILDSIMQDQFKDYSGACWGLPFAYANRKGLRPKNVGDVVATAFVHQGLWEYYNYNKQEHIKNTMLSCSDFVLNDLGMRETPVGMSLNYETQNPSNVLNSIGFASDILVRNFKITQNPQELETTEKLLDYIVHFQDDNGLFPYSIINNTKRYQTDFHQLYVISSLLNFQQATNTNKYQKIIDKGLQFYLKYQLSSKGRVLWRYPAKYPVDIHNQASALYYLSRFAFNLDFETAIIDKVFSYTIENFYYAHKSYFYYQKYPYLTNKVNYIRWGQAWMMIALSQYSVFKAHFNEL